MVFLEMLDLRTLIRKLLNSFQDDLYTCISSFSLSFFLMVAVERVFKQSQGIFTFKTSNMQ